MDEHQALAQGLSRRRADRVRVEQLSAALQADALPWKQLEGLLGPEIDRFERQQIATAYARFHDGRTDAIDRRQDFLVRTAVTSVLFNLPELEERLLELIQKRGVISLPHHLIRAFVDAGGSADDVFEASVACRVAAFEIEVMLRSTTEREMSVDDVVTERNRIVGALWKRLAAEKIPFNWTGVALLWVTALIDLGATPTGETPREGTLP